MKRVLTAAVLVASTVVALPVWACGSNASRTSNTTVPNPTGNGQNGAPAPGVHMGGGQNR